MCARCDGGYGPLLEGVIGVAAAAAADHFTICIIMYEIEWGDGSILKGYLMVSIIRGLQSHSHLQLCSRP